MDRASSARPLIELEPDMPLRSRASDRIYSALKHRILTCSLQPGQRLMEKEFSRKSSAFRGLSSRGTANRLALEQLGCLRPIA